MHAHTISVKISFHTNVGISHVVAAIYGTVVGVRVCHIVVVTVHERNK